MANDIVTVPDNDSLKTIGWVSYILHLIVAVGAVVPSGRLLAEDARQQG